MVCKSDRSLTICSPTNFLKIRGGLMFLLEIPEGVQNVVPNRPNIYADTTDRLSQGPRATGFRC